MQMNTEAYVAYKRALDAGWSVAAAIAEGSRAASNGNPVLFRAARGYLEELQERVKHMGGNSRVFNLFEGLCPNCFHDLESPGHSGGSDEIGDPTWFQWRCANPLCTGRTHYTERTEGGDWATN